MGRRRPVSLFSLLLNILVLICGFSGAYSAQAATITVPAGGDFQAALDKANPGDSIVLQAGATYVGSFKLPRKNGDQWITIKTSAPASSLPPANERVTPQYSKVLAKLVSPGRNLPVLRTAAGAHHYKLIGIDFGTQTAAEMTSLVTLGNDESKQTSLDQVPHHLVFDRCYFHAFAQQTLRRGLTINSAHTEILNSYFKGFKSKGQDAQAISGWNGPGPFRIINNYLEASGENIMFGGANVGIDKLIPSDIEIRHNHFYKPLSWKGVWAVKNLFEIKFARRVTVEGNIFENCWADAQTGFAINLKVSNPGRTPWAVTEDIKFVNNIIRHAGGGISLLGRDYRDASEGVRRVKIANNLFEDIGGAWGKGIFLSVTEGPEHVTLEHNTVIQDHSAIVLDSGKPCPDFNFLNNLIFHNQYGVKGSGLPIGNATWNAYAPGGIFAGNVLIGGKSSFYPAGNYFPATIADVKMTDYARGKYNLRTNSNYATAATDGTQVGCDYSQIEEALKGAQEGAGDDTVEVAKEQSNMKTVVLYPAKAAVKVGAWKAESDSSAAGGAYLIHPEGSLPGGISLPKIKSPLAAPSHYFEMSFYAEAGKPYHLWMRGRARGNSYSNDSVYVQFSDAQTSSGSALWPIGTAQGTPLILEDGSGAGVEGWGWQDNKWEGLAAPFYFANTGMHTIRVQTREDGFAIDQIILSPDTFLSTSPGALKKDQTTLPQSDGRP
jgi:hypothetical protein